MITFLAIGFLLSVLAVFPAFAMAIYAERQVSRHLKAHHPQLWAQIAPPPGAEPNASSPFARFITQRRYRELKDEQLNHLGERARSRLYVAASVFLALVLFGLSYSAVTRG
jgi:hypothetical protein